MSGAGTLRLEVSSLLEFHFLFFLEFHFLVSTSVGSSCLDTRDAAPVLTPIGCPISICQYSSPQFRVPVSVHPLLDPQNAGPGSESPTAALGGPGPDRDLGG